MGEATYYLKARFASETRAKKACDLLEKRIKELIKLNDAWQKLRNERICPTCKKAVAGGFAMGTEGKKHPHEIPIDAASKRSCQERKEELAKKYLLAAELVEWGKAERDCAANRNNPVAVPEAKRDDSMNCLAGPMPDMSENYELEVNGNHIFLSCIVWHFTSWDGIVQWLEAHDAQRAAYISDEHSSYFDLVDA